FEFKDLMPRNQALELLNESDMALAITHTSGSEVAIPAKFYEYIALGIPVLAITHDPLLTDAIEKFDLGRWVPHENTKRLADLLVEWAQNPGEVSQMRKPRFHVEYFDARSQI